MTRTLKAHFDGKVIVPDEPVDLPANQELVVHVEQTPGGTREPDFGTAAYLVRHLQPMSDEDAADLRRAMSEADQHIEPDPDVNFD